MGLRFSSMIVPSTFPTAPALIKSAGFMSCGRAITHQERARRDVAAGDGNTFDLPDLGRYLVEDVKLHDRVARVAGTGVARRRKVAVLRAEQIGEPRMISELLKSEPRVSPPMTEMISRSWLWKGATKRVARSRIFPKVSPNRLTFGSANLLDNARHRRVRQVHGRMACSIRESAAGQCGRSPPATS